MQVDNEGVVKQAQTSVAKPSAAHYRCVQAYVRQLGEEGVLQVEKVDSEENPADFFTKPLEPKLFERHRWTIMGPQQPPQEEE